MKELLIQHQQDGKKVKRFRLKPKNGVLFTVGSGRNCDIRIMGDNIDVVHACLEYRNDEWLLIDLCSESGTWVNGKSIVEYSIGDKLDASLGSHKLIIDVVFLKSYNIFRNPKKIDLQGNDSKVYQQIAVFYQDTLWESYLHPATKEAKIRFDRKYYGIPVPKDSSWKEFELGKLRVRSRLVRGCAFKSKEEKSFWKKLFPEDLIKPMGVAFGSTVLFFLSLYVIPLILSPDPGKLEENKYTKLMFDQKTIEKQKKKAKKIAKKLEKPKPKPKPKLKPKKKPKPKVVLKKKIIKKRKVVAVKKKPSKKVSKVVNTIKAARLSALVGKVSRRAAGSAKLVKGFGVKAGTKNKKTSRGFASLKDFKRPKVNPKSFRVGGISTKGTAGGQKVSSRLGGLSGSTVGAASVSALETETEIQGGLTAEQIKGVVQKHIGAVRYCYERQLLTKPDLFGKIKVEFVINGQGRIISQKIKSTTMKNSMVEGCILRKIKRWVFPEPTGGTEVAVSYPFYFKAVK